MFGNLHAQNWAPEYQLSVAGGFNVHVAADANGNAVAVWQQEGGISDSIWAAYFSGGVWGPSVQIGFPPVDQTFESPEVAMDASGNALAIWAQEDAGGIWTSFFTGGTWGPQTLISNSGANTLKVSMDGISKGIGGWDDGNEIGLSFFNGTTWEPATFLGTNAAEPSVAISPTGTALVTWTEFSTGQIFSNFFNGTIWGPDTLISTGVNNQNSDVGMSATGLGVAVWNNGTDVFAAQFNGATWSVPVILSTGINNDSSHVDVQADGRAAAVWSDGSNNIAAALFNGTAWTAPTIISDVSGNGEPEVAMDGRGNVVAVWAFNNGATHQIVSAFHRTGGLNVWESPLIVGTDGILVYAPDAAFSQSGRAFAVWNTEGALNPFASFIDPIIPSPLNFTGTSCTDRFAWQRDCVHILTWTPVADAVVTSYRLRRNGTVIANVPTTGPFTFIDHNRCNRTDVYSLSSVTAFGGESLPVFVTLR